MPPKRRDTLPKTHRRAVGKTPVASGQPRRVSRRDREEKQRRQLFWGLGIAGALIIVILAGAALNEYWIKPRHVLATVDGTDIRRRDYWKYRAVDLADQANQYAAIANSPFVDQSQAQQYVQLAQQANAQIDGVWGSTDLDDATLQKMIDDQIYLKSVDEFNISISDQDVQDYIDERFQPAEAPIFTPTPTPTLIPQRAAWATETAIAAIPTAPSLDGTPEAAGTPEASPAMNNMPQPVDSAASPAASPALDSATPVSDGMASPVASPVADGMTSPTPNQEQARQTATANFSDYSDAIFDRAHLSRSDYIRLIVRPAIAKERIDEQLTMNVGQSAEQVRASHILVDTKDLADSIYADLTAGGDFAQTARDQSIDSGTAQNGGDLGWFTRGQMVDQFEQVAFSTPPGQISAPFQTEFGWHIIQVQEYAADRAMTDDQITQMRGAMVDDWLTAKKDALKISSDIKPTPTPGGPANFVPPPDAPALPTATAEPTLAPIASPELPIASPAADITVEPITTPVMVSTPEMASTPMATPNVVTSPEIVATPAPASPTVAATPVATMESSPIASPIVTLPPGPQASPAASPAASPIASPMASPVASPMASPAVSPTP